MAHEIKQHGDKRLICHAQVNRYVVLWPRPRAAESATDAILAVCQTARQFIVGRYLKFTDRPSRPSVRSSVVASALPCRGRGQSVVNQSVVLLAARQGPLHPITLEVHRADCGDVERTVVELNHAVVDRSIGRNETGRNSSADRLQYMSIAQLTATTPPSGRRHRRHCRRRYCHGQPLPHAAGNDGHQLQQQEQAAASPYRTVFGLG
jgi:hypothetical protein